MGRDPADVRAPRDAGPGARLRAIALVAVLLVACGPDVRRARAEHTVELATRAITLVDETSGGEIASTPELTRAREDAGRWLEQSEQAVDAWPGTGSLAFETMVPCLGRSLGVLRESLARNTRPIPESLRQAEALARTATERRCARRRARSE